MGQMSLLSPDQQCPITEGSSKHCLQPVAWPHSFFICYQIPEGKGVAPFTSAFTTSVSTLNLFTVHLRGLAYSDRPLGWSPDNVNAHTAWSLMGVCCCIASANTKYLDYKRFLCCICSFCSLPLAEDAVWLPVMFGGLSHSTY